MALRTVCAAALRTGTDLGVNNARTFVTTGIVTILLNYIGLTFRNFLPRIQSCLCGVCMSGYISLKQTPVNVTCCPLL